MCFVETKLDDTDIISLPGFDFISQPRKQPFYRKSGGIAVFVKKSISKYINSIESQSDYILWLSFDKRLTGTDESLVLETSYIPPTQSRFFNEEEIERHEGEIMSMCSRNKYVCITGDLNAQIGHSKDYVEMDEYLSHMFNFDEETTDFFDKS